MNGSKLVYRISLWLYEHRNHSKSIAFISTERVVNILHTRLCMRKLYEDGCHDCSQSNKNAFVWRLRSKIWPIWTAIRKICLRERSKQWHKRGESAPKRPKTQQWAGKVRASVLYWSILCCMIGSIGWRNQEETPIFEEEKILFHYDNAPSHTSDITQAKKHELGFESPYACSVFSRPGSAATIYLFLNLKKLLYGRRFESNQVNRKQKGILEGLTNRIIWKVKKS